MNLAWIPQIHSPHLNMITSSLERFDIKQCLPLEKTCEWKWNSLFIPMCHNMMLFKGALSDLNYQYTFIVWDTHFFLNMGSLELRNNPFKIKLESVTALESGFYAIRARATPTWPRSKGQAGPMSNLYKFHLLSAENILKTACLENSFPVSDPKRHYWQFDCLSGNKMCLFEVIVYTKQ